MSHDSPDRHLLDPRRWTKALVALIVLYPAIFVYKLLQNYAVLPSEGQTDGYDFMAFWSAAVMALDGRAATAYEFESLGLIQQTIFPLDVGLYPWLYPPSFQLLLMPLGLLPYLLAYLIWTLGTLGFLCAVLWRFVPHRSALLVLLAMPLTDRAFATGQTSFLTTALLGLFALALERRPARAGFWLGLVTVKPQLGVLAPIALLVDRRWTTIAAAGVTALALGAISVLAFGTTAWLNFFDSMSWISQTLADSPNVLAVIASPFSTLRLAGVGLETAYALHIAVAIAAALLVAWVWWRPFAIDLKLACLIAAAALISPLHHDYDLMILVVPCAILARRALRESWLKAEPAGLFFIWLFPGLATVIAVNTGVQMGFVAPIVMLALCLRRTVRSVESPPPKPADHRPRRSDRDPSRLTPRTGAKIPPQRIDEEP